jgi:hypothetical protein
VRQFSNSPIVSKRATSRKKVRLRELLNCSNVRITAGWLRIEQTQCREPL